MPTDQDRADFEALLTHVWEMTREVPQAEIDEMIREGRENPLSRDESRRLLTLVVKRLAARKISNVPQDEAGQAALVEEMISAKHGPAPKEE